MSNVDEPAVATTAMRIDRGTGLPVLPEGYLWRVSPGGDDSTRHSREYRQRYVRVELVHVVVQVIPQKIAFFGRRVLREQSEVRNEKVVDWKFATLPDTSYDRRNLKTRILDEAITIYGEKFGNPVSVLPASARAVIGDYPPRTLGESK